MSLNLTNGRAADCRIAITTICPLVDVLCGRKASSRQSGILLRVLEQPSASGHLHIEQRTNKCEPQLRLLRRRLKLLHIESLIIPLPLLRSPLVSGEHSDAQELLLEAAQEYDMGRALIDFSINVSIEVEDISINSMKDGAIPGWELGPHQISLTARVLEIRCDPRSGGASP